MVSKLHLNALTEQASSIWTFINMVRGAMTALCVYTFTATRETHRHGYKVGNVTWLLVPNSLPAPNSLGCYDRDLNSVILRGHSIT